MNVSLKLLLLLGLVTLSMTQDYDGDDDDDDDDFAAASGDQYGPESGIGGGGGGRGGFSSYGPQFGLGSGGGLYGGQSNFAPDDSAASEEHPSLLQALKPETKKVKRSIGGNEKKKSLIRVRRGHGYGVAGPVYTYVKTDYHGNFKWGARHNVGKGYGRRR